MTQGKPAKPLPPIWFFKVMGVGMIIVQLFCAVIVASIISGLPVGDMFIPRLALVGAILVMGVMILTARIVFGLKTS